MHLYIIKLSKLRERNNRSHIVRVTASLHERNIVHTYFPANILLKNNKKYCAKRFDSMCNHI